MPQLRSWGFSCSKPENVRFNMNSRCPCTKKKRKAKRAGQPRLTFFIYCSKKLLFSSFLGNLLLFAFFTFFVFWKQKHSGPIFDQFQLIKSLTQNCEQSEETCLPGDSQLFVTYAAAECPAKPARCPCSSSETGCATWASCPCLCGPWPRAPVARAPSAAAPRAPPPPPPPAPPAPLQPAQRGPSQILPCDNRHNGERREQTQTCVFALCCQPNLELFEKLVPFCSSTRHPCFDVASHVHHEAFSFLIWRHQSVHIAEKCMCCGDMTATHGQKS